MSEKTPIRVSIQHVDYSNSSITQNEFTLTKRRTRRLVQGKAIRMFGTLLKIQGNEYAEKSLRSNISNYQYEFRNPQMPNENNVVTLFFGRDPRQKF